MTQPCSLPLAKTPRQVVERIDTVLEQSLAGESRVGLFAALYRHVATSVDAALHNHVFEHPKLMGCLNVVFFNRYLTALSQHRLGEECSRCWRKAFDAADGTRRLSVVQHLALGMNAHINFDLALGVADAIPLQWLPSVERDFARMNELLANLLTRITRQLGTLSPAYRAFDRAFGTVDDGAIHFSMRKARAFAWARALELAAHERSEHPRLSRNADSMVALMQDALTTPPAPLCWGLALATRLERHDVRTQITRLCESSAAKKLEREMQRAPNVTPSPNDPELASAVPAVS